MGLAVITEYSALQEPTFFFQVKRTALGNLGPNHTKRTSLNRYTSGNDLCVEDHVQNYLQSSVGESQRMDTPWIQYSMDTKAPPVPGFCWLIDSCKLLTHVNSVLNHSLTKDK